MPTDASLVGRLADALADRWRAGDRVPTEHLLDEHPHLWADPPAALELLAEELAQRDGAGLPVCPHELAARFPDWGPQVRALAACQRALGRPAPPAFPTPGDRLGEFDLLELLGTGGHGRVYRAAQPHLGGRRVVLKVGPDTGGEHLSLARLQHTHVVPLYSVHDFPDRRLRGLCLPDFGGRTLAHLLAHKPGRGADILRLVGPAPAPGAAAGFLGRATLADALCWVGACLADGLQAAHEQQLLHLDVKPSNVLVAADGTPMLLDFHLARPPLAAGPATGTWLGGTPGHMAPEQEAAVSAVRQGRPVPQAVDARADVFALGRMLREAADALGCRLTPGLRAVLAKAAEPRPARRYPTAGDLAADLRRHLADLPLRGVPNRNLPERWAKWRRRQPRALPAVATAVGVLALGAGSAAHVERLATQAAAALPEADRLLTAGRPDEAAERLRLAVATADGLPLHPRLADQLRGRLRDAERAAAGARLRTVAEQARWVLAGQAPPEQAAAVVRACREVWARRAEVEAAGGAADDLHDVGAAAGERGLGRPGTTATTAQRVARGRERLEAGDLGGALADFDAAAGGPDRSVWPHHYRGVALLRLGRPVEAVGAFGACVALLPEADWCRHNRELAVRAARLP